MTDTSRAIQTAIQRLAGTFKTDQVQYFIGDVKSVNTRAATCVVTLKGNSAEIDLPNVQLASGICDGLLIIPVVGSEVKVMTSIHNDPFICQFSDIDSFFLQTASGIEFNNGDNGGLIKIQKALDDVNELKHQLNNILTVLKGINITLAPSGNVPFAPFFAALNNLNDSLKNNWEDTSVKH